MVTDIDDYFKQEDILKVFVDARGNKLMSEFNENLTKSQPFKTVKQRKFKKPLPIEESIHKFTCISNMLNNHKKLQFERETIQQLMDNYIADTDFNSTAQLITRLLKSSFLHTLNGIWIIDMIVVTFRETEKLTLTLVKRLSIDNVEIQLIALKLITALLDASLKVKKDLIQMVECSGARYAVNQFPKDLESDMKLTVADFQEVYIHCYKSIIHVQTFPLDPYQQNLISGCLSILDIPEESPLYQASLESLYSSSFIALVIVNRSLRTNTYFRKIRSNFGLINVMIGVHGIIIRNWIHTDQELSNIKHLFLKLEELLYIGIKLYTRLFLYMEAEDTPNDTDLILATISHQFKLFLSLNDALSLELLEKFLKSKTDEQIREEYLRMMVTKQLRDKKSTFLKLRKAVNFTCIETIFQSHLETMMKGNWMVMEVSLLPTARFFQLDQNKSKINYSEVHVLRNASTPQPPLINSSIHYWQLIILVQFSDIIELSECTESKVGNRRWTMKLKHHDSLMLQFSSEKIQIDWVDGIRFLLEQVDCITKETKKDISKMADLRLIPIEFSLVA
ncbi:hypothetical protein BC833DRAFT_588610 [Globomyces pollinis-pini]|nr:hypothetical protein BC833DRAFT_588610 [Globomyces pollinis-pini]